MTPAEALKREQAKAAREKLELAMLQQLRSHGMGEMLASGTEIVRAGWVRQYRFHPQRRWLFDLAWTYHRLAVEVDGGTWSGGRHTRGAGFEADCEKLNEAVCLGWRVIRVTGAHIKSGKAIEWIERALGDRL